MRRASPTYSSEQPGHLEASRVPQRRSSTRRRTSPADVWTSVARKWSGWAHSVGTYRTVGATSATTIPANRHSGGPAQSEASRATLRRSASAPGRT